MRKIWGVARLRFRQLLTSIRLPVVLGLVLLYLLALYQPLRRIAALTGMGITPYSLIFLLGDQTGQLTLCALSLALFANAPFRDEMNDLITARSGRTALALGNCLYILMASVFYVVMLFVIQMLICLPYTRLSLSWDPMLRAIAIGALPEGVSLLFYLDSWVMSQFSPLAALGLSIALETLCVFLLGLLVYLGNRLFRRPVGLWASGALVMLDITIYNILTSSWYRYSPLGLARLGMYQSLPFSDGFRYFALTSFVIIASLILIEKYAPKLGKIRHPGAGKENHP